MFVLHGAHKKVSPKHALNIVSLTPPKGRGYIVFGVGHVGIGFTIFVFKISHELEGGLETNLQGYKSGA